MPSIDVTLESSSINEGTAGGEFFLSTGTEQEYTWRVASTIHVPPSYVGGPVQRAYIYDDSADVIIQRSYAVLAYDPGASAFVPSSALPSRATRDTALLGGEPEPTEIIGPFEIAQPYRGVGTYPETIEGALAVDASWTIGWPFVFLNDGTSSSRAGSYMPNGAAFAPTFAHVRRVYNSETREFVFTAYMGFFATPAMADPYTGEEIEAPIPGWEGDAIVEWEIDGAVTTIAPTASGEPFPIVAESTSPSVTWPEGTERPLVRVRAIDRWGQKSSWQKLLFWPEADEGETIGTIQTPDGALIMARAEGSPKAVKIRRMEENATTGTVISTLNGYSRPRLTHRKNGQIVLMARNDATKQFERKISLNGGENWS